MQQKIANFWRWSLLIDPRGTEIISSLSLVSWAFVVLVGDWSINPAYTGMREVMSAGSWAVIVGFIGGIQYFSLLSNDYTTRLASAVMACLVFFMLLGFTFQAAPGIPLPYIYGILGVANGWAVGQLSK